MRKTKPIAWQRPILTRSSGVRGQVDLIDFQSIPDGSFKHLLVYVDHGIKQVFTIPIVAKRASTIAFALFQIFKVIGPPVILQSDKGREFSDAAQSRTEKLEDDFLDEVILEIKKLWKGCSMVRGSPCYSPANGGVERMNYNIETKLVKWMADNKSTAWSIGCHLIQW